MTVLIAAAVGPIAPAAADGTAATLPQDQRRIAHRGIKKPPPPPPPPSEIANAAQPFAVRWNGLYVGASVGLGFATVSGTSSTLANNLADDFSSQGGFGGIYAGRTWQMDAVVFGFEVDATRGFGFGSQIADSLLDPSGRQMMRATPDFQSSLRLRVGYPLDRALLYVTGGAAVSNWNISESYPTLGAYDSISSWRLGWIVGAGIDYALTSQWSGRLEYRFSDFGTVQYFSGATPSLSYQERLYESYLGVGFGYRF